MKFCCFSFQAPNYENILYISKTPQNQTGCPATEVVSTHVGDGDAEHDECEQSLHGDGFSRVWSEVPSPGPRAP